MSDFVTLSCPSCGGKLTVQKNSPTYICDYCGTEHKLREEDIEFFGRCPKCHRNDRVEKITAILNRNDQLASKFPPPGYLNLDRFLWRPDVSAERELNAWLTSRIPENKYKKWSRYCFIGMAVLLVLSCFASSLGTGSETNSSNNGFFFLFSLFLGIVLAISGVFYAIKGDRNQREQESEAINRVQTLEREKAAQANEVHQQRAHLQQVLWSRYDQIYYCHRDDLLFIPGESDYASCDDFEGYLTYILETN